MIVQILKVFDISAIFEEESWLPTDLKLGAAYLPAQQRRYAMQARKPPTTESDWLSSVRGQIGEASLERHFSVGELASLWDLSEQTIRRMFAGEPGVIEWGHGESRFKRGYITGPLPIAQHKLRHDGRRGNRPSALDVSNGLRSTCWPSLSVMISCSKNARKVHSSAGGAAPDSQGRG